MASFTNHDMWKLELQLKGEAREAARLDVAFDTIRSDVTSQAEATMAAGTSYQLAHAPLVEDYRSAYVAGIREFQNRNPTGSRTGFTASDQLLRRPGLHNQGFQP